MEGVDGVFASGAQRDMDAGRLGLRRKTLAQVEPQFGIVLAEADTDAAIDDFAQAQGLEHVLVEGGAFRHIADRDGDVIDHGRNPKKRPHPMLGRRGRTGKSAGARGF